MPGRNLLAPLAGLAMAVIAAACLVTFSVLAQDTVDYTYSTRAGHPLTPPSGGRGAVGIPIPTGSRSAGKPGSKTKPSARPTPGQAVASAALSGLLGAPSDGGTPPHVIPTPPKPAENLKPPGHSGGSEGPGGHKIPAGAGTPGHSGAPEHPKPPSTPLEHPKPQPAPSEHPKPDPEPTDGDDHGGDDHHEGDEGDGHGGDHGGDHGDQGDDGHGHDGDDGEDHDDDEQAGDEGEGDNADHGEHGKDRSDDRDHGDDQDHGDDDD